MPRPTRRFKCSSCSYEFESPYGVPRPQACPKCGAKLIHRVDTGPRRAGYGRGSSGYMGSGRGHGRGAGSYGGGV